jgi:hypothetical protein
MKMAVFWDVAPCSLVGINRQLLLPPSSGRCSDALMMEAVSTFEMSFNIYQTTRRNIPEDSHLQANK